MNNLKNKIWFKIISVIVIQLFLLSQSVYALNVDDKYQEQKKLSNESPTDKSQTQAQNNNVVITGYSEIASQGGILNVVDNQKEAAAVVAELGDVSALVKVTILKAMDCSIGEAVAALMGNGISAVEASAVLIEVGYDRTQVEKYLGGIISKIDNVSQSDKIVNTSILAVQTVSIKVDNSSISSVAEVKTESAQVKVDDQTKLTTISAVIPQSNSAEVTYASLAAKGASDIEIVAALKDQGSSATDILKASTELGQDMASVAGAMKSAGFSNADIAKAYIAKAMDWATDTTVDVVNCAVQSLAEVLTGQGSIVSTVALAYEVIVSDIMQTGKVNIQDGQIMSSMSAIKDVAAEKGVQLQGVSGTMADLENASGSTIVHVDNNHWVTVTNVNGDAVTVMDNNGKEVTMTKAELQSRWDGNMLTQGPTNATALTGSQMVNILGADIGDASGNSFGAGNEENNSNGGYEGHEGFGPSGNASNGGYEGHEGFGPSGNASNGGYEGHEGFGPDGNNNIGNIAGPPSGIFSGFFSGVADVAKGVFGVISNAISDKVSGFISGVETFSKDVDKIGIIGAISNAVDKISLGDVVGLGISLSVGGLFGFVAGEFGKGLVDAITKDTTVANTTLSSDNVTKDVIASFDNSNTYNAGVSLFADVAQNTSYGNSFFSGNELATTVTTSSDAEIYDSYLNARTAGTDVHLVNGKLVFPPVTTSTTSTSSENQITSLYNEVLGRAPESAGLAYWTDKLNNGMTVDQVKSSMMDSEEYKKNQAGVVTISQNIGYKSIPNVDPNMLSLDVYSPTNTSGSNESVPLVVYVHGGGWTQGDKAGWAYGNVKPMADYFSSKGYVFASVNYRLAPDVNASTCNQDVADAISYMVDNASTYNVDSSNISLMGHSAGGGIVAAISTDESYLLNCGLSLSSIKGTILLDAEGLDVYNSAQYADSHKGEYGNPEMYSTAFGVDPDGWLAASPQEHIAQGKGIPNFMIVTTGSTNKNGLAPVQYASSFKIALENVGVQATLLETPTLNHVEINNAVGIDKVVTPALQSFLDFNRLK